jgi:phosphatidylglycerophosphate synthase
VTAHEAETAFDDPLNRWYRYPLARLLVAWLLHTRVSANHVTFVQPLFAAAAGYLVTFADRRHLVLGALLFEIRSVLDCADGTLARARGGGQPGGHALDAAADWLGTVFLYAGIYWHFRLHPPVLGFWSCHISLRAVLLLALAQGALRSFSADHYKRKLAADLSEPSRKGASSPGASRVEAWIEYAERLLFEGGRADRPSPHPKLARVVTLAWSISNGDAFLSLVTLSILADRMWEAQVFFAVAGFPWILLLLLLTARVRAS